MAKTVDNLGVEISNRYAFDQEIFDKALIKEAPSIPRITRVNVTTPFHPSEFNMLFGLDQVGNRWATFTPPAGYSSFRGGIFSQQLIPEFGSPDGQEIKEKRVEAVGNEEKKRETLKPNEVENIESEKQILKKLLNSVHNFDEILIDINARRTQYQKG